MVWTDPRLDTGTLERALSRLAERCNVRRALDF